MKKTYFLMLLALVFLVFSCRSELDNLQESEPGSVTVKKSFSSHLISLKTVKEEVKSFNNIQAKFTILNWQSLLQQNHLTIPIYTVNWKMQKLVILPIPYL